MTFNTIGKNETDTKWQNAAKHCNCGEMGHIRPHCPLVTGKTGEKEEESMASGATVKQNDTEKEKKKPQVTLTQIGDKTDTKDKSHFSF